MKSLRCFIFLGYMTCLFSCRPDLKNSSLLQLSALPSQFIEVNTELDTTVALTGGTLLYIAKNSIKSKSGTIASLEIKEALTIEQMVTAGLTTQSDGKTLQSGGMLYINPAGSNAIELLKPIRVRIPATVINPKMSLFTGEEKEGRINWVDPQPLSFPESKPTQGETLFAANCASCHGVNKESTGPALYGSMERWHGDTSLVYDYTRNSQAVIANNKYACCLYNKYNKTPMNLFPSLTDADLHALYKYIDQEGRKIWGEVPPHLRSRSSCDSCDIHQRQLARLMKKRQAINNELLNRSNSRTSPKDTSGFSGINEQTDPVVPNYYTFEIKSFGWVNIDCFLDTNPATRESELVVRLQGSYSSSIRVLLAIPAYKVLTEGRFTAEKQGYVFFSRDDGSVRLPQDIEACIIAMGAGKETNELAFGLNRFIIRSSQQLVVSVKKATDAEIQSGIRALRFPEFDMDIQKDTLLMNQQLIDQQIDSMQKVFRRLPDCDCVSDTLIESNAIFDYMNAVDTVPAPVQEFRRGPARVTSRKLRKR